MKKILITTGGSGGHVIPSLSMYDAIKDNFEVHIVTDLRGSKYINSKTILSPLAGTIHLYLAFRI